MTSTEQQDDGYVVYPWRCAPAHLRTRRQLATQGLRPNGQDPVAEVARPRRRREPLTAYLYDIRRAAPKREATPAQLAALAKATRERQLRAAERHGISREEMEADVELDSVEVSLSPREPIPGHAFAGLVDGRGREREGLER